MLARATKPKLSLAVPATAFSPGLKSPFPLPISPSHINSPTARNTVLNQRGFSTTQAPTFAYAKTTDTKSILKKNAPTSTAIGEAKHIKFCEIPTITCVSPMPEGYYGEYIKMSRDDRRWATGVQK